MYDVAISKIWRLGPFMLFKAVKPVKSWVFQGLGGTWGFLVEGLQGPKLCQDRVFFQGPKWAAGNLDSALHHPPPGIYLREHSIRSVNKSHQVPCRLCVFAGRSRSCYIEINICAHIVNGDRAPMLLHPEGYLNREDPLFHQV